MAVWRTKAYSTFQLKPGAYSFADGKRDLFADMVEWARKAIREGNQLRLRQIAGYVTWAAGRKSDCLDSVVDLAFFLPVFRDAALREELRLYMPVELLAEKWKLLMEQASDELPPA